MSIKHEIPINNTDVNISIKVGGKLLGRLQISSGTIDWKPRGKRSSYRLTWKEFGDLMVQSGRQVP